MVKPRPDHVVLIEGMMCMKNCGATVEKAIRAVSGVQNVVVSLKDAKADVWGPTSSGVAIIDALESVGFDATFTSSVEMSPLHAPPTEKQIVLRVEGMMCQKNCGQTVEKTLKGVKGVTMSLRETRTHISAHLGA